jgi:arsenate reductase (thioredoxin)
MLKAITKAPGAIVSHWSFEDPVAFSGTEEEPLAKFREVRDQIEARVRAFVEVGA